MDGRRPPGCPRIFDDVCLVIVVGNALNVCYLAWVISRPFSKKKKIFSVANPMVGSLSLVPFIQLTKLHVKATCDILPFKR